MSQKAASTATIPAEAPAPAGDNKENPEATAGSGPRTPGQIAYEAYGKARDWKTFEKKPMPPFNGQIPELQKAWEVAAETLIKEWPISAATPATNALNEIAALLYQACQSCPEETTFETVKRIVKEHEEQKRVQPAMRTGRLSSAGLLLGGGVRVILNAIASYKPEVPHDIIFFGRHGEEIGRWHAPEELHGKKLSPDERVEIRDEMLETLDEQLGIEDANS